MLVVDQDFLEKIISVVQKRMSEPEIRDEVVDLVGDKDRKVNAVVNSLIDTASFLCRRDLSGLKIDSPLELISRIEKIIYEARTTVFANLRGIPIGELDTAKEALKRKLKEDLEEISSVFEFSRRMNVDKEVEVRVVEQISSGQPVNKSDVLNFIRKAVESNQKMQKIRLFTDEDKAVLRGFVANGKIYKFEADALEKALLSFYHTENGEEIKAVLNRLTRR